VGSLVRRVSAHVRARIEATFDTAVEQTRRSAAEFVWDAAMTSVDDLARVRRTAMETNSEF